MHVDPLDIWVRWQSPQIDLVSELGNWNTRIMPQECIWNMEMLMYAFVSFDLHFILQNHIICQHKYHQYHVQTGCFIDDYWGNINHRYIKSMSPAELAHKVSSQIEYKVLSIYHISSCFFRALIWEWLAMLVWERGLWPLMLSLQQLAYRKFMVCFFLVFSLFFPFLLFNPQQAKRIWSSFPL